MKCPLGRPNLTVRRTAHGPSGRMPLAARRPEGVMSCSPVLEREGLLGPNETRVTSSLELPPRPRSVAQARAFVANLDLPLEDDGMAVLVLLTSELVTNSVLHARTRVDLCVTVTDAAVVVA